MQKKCIPIQKYIVQDKNFLFKCEYCYYEDHNNVCLNGKIGVHDKNILKTNSSVVSVIRNTQKMYSYKNIHFSSYKH